ncbi:Slam-dependent surface lipoprotein [Actinobacillus arthritidis]|uniref:Slam-dependent surface lipoprotein n=1 Tax=Actinobacillus arthritidis TaxID=157339 RepID=UPI0024433B44|nr:Slam-dependent surface lipoprotein [Actinobacillus arthritidis]WGE89566.1 transferrin-binding protein-like solute binding protein [Actinobacillus arthritidis]
MKMLKLSFLTTLVLTLVACGGGGGGSSAKEQVKKAMNELEQKIEQEKASSQKTVESKPNTENQSDQTTPSYRVYDPNNPPKNNAIQNTSSTQLDNGLSVEQFKFPKGEINNQDIEYGKISGYNRNYSFNGAWLESEKEPTILDVAGKKIATLAQEKASALGGLTGSALAKALGGAYNWVMSQENDPERQMFYFGNETLVENIPVQGKITYQGNATRYDNLTQSVKNIGTSTLVADFDNKKISGDLIISGLRRNISLKETDIKGNSFEGQAVTNVVHREGVYEGKFFGPNAEEVAGKATFGITEQRETSVKRS